MKIRRASGEEMLALWGYADLDTAPPTARFFFQNIAAGNAVFWTLDRDGELLGELYAFLNIREDQVFADGTTTAYLCAFRVKREYRGRGFGSRLMEVALSDLQSMGFRRATIGVDAPRNEAFYRRLGFVTDVKTCYLDPCARDEYMQPEPDDTGYLLLEKEL
jgi:GNAT superfamily N-acetyltransferase